MFEKFVEKHIEDLTHIANAVRSLSMDAVLKAKSGHIGLPLGCAEIGTLLYFAVMNYSPKNPNWIDRDRFVLSAGHGSMLLYSLLHLAGYDLNLEDLKQFRQLHSKTPGHPEYGHSAGVECTTGPLGQGLSMAVGMALSERMLNARFPHVGSNDIIDHRTFVLAGDGCLMEGVTSEACSLAGHLKLNRLIVLYDANNITIDGTVDITFSEDVAKRYESYGFRIFHAEANDFLSLAKAMDLAYENSLLPNGESGPSLIICKGIAGKGSPKWEGKHKIHGNPMSAEDVAEAKKHLGLPADKSFYVSPEACEASKTLLSFREQKFLRWNSVLDDILSNWKSNQKDIYRLWFEIFTPFSAQPFQEEQWKLAKGKMATRVSGGKALVELAKSNPRLVGGSADLAGSNLTTLPDTSFVSAKDFSGRNIHFGVREHGMAAICNGITLHGAFQAFCATFLVFSDYLRPAIRLAALMKIPTLFIFTHDSYGVGEDGPTHQPVEHADALRAIPNLCTLRPADGLETFAAWENAVTKNTMKPTAFLLTRQDLPDLDEHLETPRLCSKISKEIEKGAYLLKDFSNKNNAKKLIFVASGSEVTIAFDAAKKLEQAQELNLSIRVVSCLCPKTLVKNPVTFHFLVPKNTKTFAIEASSGMSFGEIVGRDGSILHMESFGASAPISVLSQEFGFTVDHFVQFVKIQLA